MQNTNNNPTISIIIPCYNEEKLIAENFNHILNQTVFPEEVIFVDNNSTDNSIKIAKSFINKFKEKGIDFKILNEKIQGQTSARILGFGQAKSELIGTLDTDSLISRNWVKVAKDIFAKNKKINLISGPFIFVNLNFFQKFTINICFILYTFSNFFFLMWGCNRVFRKKIYNKLNGLKDYNEASKKLNLKYVYDDNFLSEKFKRFGKVKFVWKLKAKGQGRTGTGSVSNRTIDQPISFFKIKKFVAQKNNF